MNNIIIIAEVLLHLSSVMLRLCLAVQLYQAIYPYSAGSDLELTLHEGLVVSVLSKKDLTGNPEWWLVSLADGRQGYVPANYLYQLT